jgi:carbamoyltransferase
MKILGLNIGHDSGAALIINNFLISAVNEERLSRIKMHHGIPYKSISEVLAIGNLEINDIDIVCIEGKLMTPLDNIDYNFREDGTSNNLRKRLLLLFNLEKLILGNKIGIFIISLFLLPATIAKRIIIRKYLKNNGFSGKILYIDHHECHAATAYFTQSVKEGLAITLDASGEGICSRVYRCRGNSMTLLHTIPCYHSPAYYYAYITQILGFKPLRHEGKITGLAAFGCPTKVAKILTNYIYFDENILSFVNTGGYHTNALNSLDNKLSKFTKEDIAAGIQLYTEQLVTNYIKSVINKFNDRKPANIFLSGGLFANVKINSSINELTCVKSTYIFPNMGDGGLGLGAALAYKRNFLRLNNYYLGKDFRKDKIEILLKKYNLSFFKSESISKDIAFQLFSGNIVARYAGRMEYGPRALGNRSILYSAKDKSVNKWLNERLSRTEFMPFAPVVRDVDANIFFKINKESDSYNHMTMTCDVTEYCKKNAPAVTHVDGTARPQIISRSVNPQYYDMITEYSKFIEAPGILVNTSFNLHEEPIVNSPEEAIKTFLDSKLDFLALEDYLISKN